MIESFKEKNKDSTQLFKNLVDEGDIEQAKFLAHSVKGIAGNLGGKKVSDACDNLYRTLEEYAEPDEELVCVVEGLEEMLGSIDQLLAIDSDISVVSD